MTIRLKYFRSNNRWDLNKVFPFCTHYVIMMTGKFPPLKFPPARLPPNKFFPGFGLGFGLGLGWRTIFRGGAQSFRGGNFPSTVIIVTLLQFNTFILFNQYFVFASQNLDTIFRHLRQIAFFKEKFSQEKPYEQKRAFF